MFDIPEWAVRHDYFHHSNPRSGDRAKKLFEKVHVRPAVKKAKATLYNLEAHETDLAQARLTIDIFHNNRGSAKMAAGRAVQDGTDLCLIPEKDTEQTLSLQEAQFIAKENLAAYRPLDYDKTVEADDKEQLEQCLEEIDRVVENAVIGLREAMARENKYIGEIELLEALPGNALPHNTFPDYARRGDLKTKWSSPQTNSKGERTWKKGYLPKTLTGMWEKNNVYQVAGFYALNGKQPPFLVYANASDYKVFDSTNSPELRPDYLDDVVRDISIQHKVTENLLRAAETKEELLGLVSPDWESFFWRMNSPAFIREARILWGME
tara:strand:+ start:1245 stop:2213 length:969 start_codon:yes stop_codon:yes gene_type:complete